MPWATRDDGAFVAWERFPVAERPRPVILLDDPVQIGARGFSVDDAKVAWLAGAIVPGVPMPQGLVDRVLGGRAEPIDVEPLRITQLSRGEASFICDRGPRRLPAYRLVIPGIFDPVWVLDPDVRLWWPPIDVLDPGDVSGAASIGADGVTLTVPAFGGYLTSFDQVQFDERPSFVVATVITSVRPTTATAIPLVGVIGKVTGQLSEPLNGRVLVRPDGQPIAVLPA